MRNIRALSLLLCAMLMLALVACDQGKTPEQTTPEITTEEPTTEAPTTEAPTEAPTTEQPTTEEPTDSSDDRPGREDFAEDDPNNPYLNLIEVGTSMDGMTKCYDGRYDFGYTICITDDGEEFSCMQDAIDYLAEWGGGVISMIDSTNVCLYLDIPQDGCFYRLAYNWHNVDFVFAHGAIYDDCTENNGVVGYAYYSDLYELDLYANLEGTYVWILSEIEGLSPGRYLMTADAPADSDFFYNYEKSLEAFEWPGLPRAEVLPD